MRKKIILRLLLVTAFMALLWSCRSEDLLQEENPAGSSTNLSSAKYASKSLWKEDELYIGKVQEVFLKHANLERFNTTYGELSWNYAMSFGQFGEKYLLVPIVKDNKVTLMMEAVRIGSKVYFYEKRDEDLLTFFQHVMYSKIIGYREDIGETAAKAKYVCSTRTIIIGCLNGATDCEPVSYSSMVCEWKESGGGTPPKTLDPLGDPFIGGGGDGGWDYPDPPEETPKDPCESTKSILTYLATTAKVQTLKEKSSINKANEFGFKVRTDGTTTEITEGKKTEWEVGSLQGIKGFYHSHPGEGINIFSPPDIRSLFVTILTSGSPGNVSDNFLGVIGSEPSSGGIKYFHYIVRYNGPIQDAGTISLANYDISNLKDNYREREKELTSILPTSPYSDNGGASLNNKGLETLFFDSLDKMNIDKNKIILQRVDEDGTVNTITLNSDGTTTPIPCP